MFTQVGRRQSSAGILFSFNPTQTVHQLEGELSDSSLDQKRRACRTVLEYSSTVNSHSDEAVSVSPLLRVRGKTEVDLFVLQLNRFNSSHEYSMSSLATAWVKKAYTQLGKPQVLWISRSTGEFKSEALRSVIAPHFFGGGSD